MKITRILKKRIFDEAMNFDVFGSITIYDPKDLDDSFRAKYKNILDQSRGAGYWLWKFYIIKKKLAEINDGDYLIYLDSGCSINSNGKNRFFEYLKLLDDSKYGIISFQMPLLEKKWITSEIFNHLDINIDSHMANSGQYIATALIMKKNQHVNLIINKCIEIVDKDQRLITDYYEKNQITDFIENRHDQSILSVVRKIYGSIVISDETYCSSFGDSESLNCPFWATRKK